MYKQLQTNTSQCNYMGNIIHSLDLCLMPDFSMCWSQFCPSNFSSSILSIVFDSIQCGAIPVYNKWYSNKKKSFGFSE